MTRVDDLPVPALTPHVLPPGSPIASWPAQLRIGLERLPQAAYTWDDADPAVVWDDPDPDRFVWDAPFIESGFTDAVCDFVSLIIDPAEPDDLGLFGPTEAVLTLANPAGEYTVWTADGRLTYWAPGRRMCVWAVVGGEDLWLFSGRVTSWAEQADGTVVVEAFDGLAALADELGGDWTPGVPGERALARARSIAAQAGYTDPIAGDLGDVTLSTEPGDATPLDAIHRAALSDGGVFAGDADGRLLYRDRLWRAGRDDQGPVPVVSDNVCTVDAVVWDLTLAADDAGLFVHADLFNLAELHATATASGADWYPGAAYRLTHPDPDLWQTQGDGDALARQLVAVSSTPALAPRGFVLHLLDPQQDLWALGVGLRRGDRVEILHDYVDANGDPATLDVFTIAASIGHEITPDSWLVSVYGTRTVDHRTVELWDVTGFTWDDPDPLNVWRY
jgi:hypothetical protein